MIEWLKSYPRKKVSPREFDALMKRLRRTVLLAGPYTRNKMNERWPAGVPRCVAARLQAGGRLSRDRLCKGRQSQDSQNPVLRILKTNRKYRVESHSQSAPAPAAGIPRREMVIPHDVL